MSINNINVSILYIPGGVRIPWETTKSHEILIQDDDNDDDIFYEIDLSNPPPKSQVDIMPQMNFLIISEKNGELAMMIPLSMVCGIGKKGSVLHGPVSIKPGTSRNH
jgi:hypothetical protein